MNKYKYKYEYITRENIKKLGITYYSMTDKYFNQSFYVVLGGKKKKFKSVELVNEHIKNMLVKLRRDKIEELL